MDELTPNDESALVERLLRDQVGLDPDHLGRILDLAAVGIVNGAWRNSPVEDWHAGEGPLTDGAMLRVNAHTTWRVREIARRWRADIGLVADSPAVVLDDLDVDATDLLAVRVWRWLVKPERRLPIGITLAELAGNALTEYAEHADRAVGGFAATAENRGARFAVWRAAAHAGLACPHWWGTPGWPQLVDRFITVLDDPTHEHWGPGARRRLGMTPEPVHVSDRARLRQVLLRRPWELDPDAAEWVVRAGIGFMGSFLRQPPNTDAAGR